MANDLTANGTPVPTTAEVTTPEVHPGEAAAVEAQEEHDRVHHGDDDTAGKPSVPDEDFDPSSVPALSAYPEPNAPTPDGVTKDSSADARQADAVPVIGWVDHDIPSVTGEIIHVHSPGVVLIRHNKASE